MSFGFRKDGAHAAQKKQRKYDTESDIRYRGPLSYRTFKILGWLCIALSQVAVLLTMEARLDPGMADALRKAIEDSIRVKDANLKGQMASEGTTPRQLTDLIGSLCDLTSGSGDKGTPIILIQGYFDNYTNE